MSQVKIFKTKGFKRWASICQISDLDLIDSATQITNGLVDASLGGYLFKKRISLEGRGKRAGGRTIVATQFKGTIFFLFGFRKNESENINFDDLKLLKLYAKELLRFSALDLDVMIKNNEIFEVTYDEY